MPWSSSRPHGNRRAAKYGTAHAKTRAQWAARHADTDPCGWCGHALGPMRPGLHLAHDPSGTVVLGFWHGPCNLQEAAKRARARQEATRLRW